MPAHKPHIFIDGIPHKECQSCLITKNICLFPKKKSNKDGLYSYCKECKSMTDKDYRKDPIVKEKCLEYGKIYYKENKELLVQKQKIYYNDHKEEHSVRSKKYYESHREEIYLYIKEQKTLNPLYKLSCSLRSRLWSVLKKKNWEKNSKFNEYIGCDKQTLVNHIESQFQPGMTWENQGIWHIDHIKPLALAKNEDELYKLNHYTNLRPLWAIDNLKKGSKYVE